MWKEVKGYEGKYLVSETGIVKSVDRYVNHINEHKQLKKGRVLKQHSVLGYNKVSLYKNGKGKSKSVHRIVAETFIPNDKKLAFVNHIDCDKSNNNINNLEWVTPKQNTEHAIKNGLFKNKEIVHKNAKLKKQEVIDIKKLKKFFTQKELGLIFGVSKSTIKDILNGNSWKDVLL